MDLNTLDDWDGSLPQFCKVMEKVCRKAKEFGLETLMLVRDTDPISYSTSYRCIRACDYIVAIGLLTIAMDDMMAGEVEEETDNG
jgi:hypothetical protein